MKRTLAIAGLVLALGLGFASAQNVTRSLQGAQDPRGPVGLDTSNSAYFPGHINAFGQTTPPVSPSGGGAGFGASCGTTTSIGTVIGVGSTDVAGTVTPQGVSCSVLFGSAFNAAPHCVVQVNSIAVTTSNTSNGLTTATTGFNMTSVMSGAQYQYICIGNQ